MGITRSSSERGTEMVVREHDYKERETNQNSIARPCDKLGCSEGSTGRLGSPLRECISRRPMDSIRETTSHKHPRIESSTISCENVHKKQEQDIHSSPTGQPSSPSTCNQNGVPNKPNSSGIDQRDLVILNAEGDHPSCKIHPISLEQRGGFLNPEMRKIEGIGN